ncbi:unnamed protein product [Moneuplotes crassus]|uniref:Uncharacterized protein n=1 Tax=Euplotes crassus TaxID=5936 RepID=A0AAD1UI19_EUPCR|nr:unnamed protein product [Moneuplotes crassus]
MSDSSLVKKLRKKRKYVKFSNSIFNGEDLIVVKEIKPPFKNELISKAIVKLAHKEKLLRLEPIAKDKEIKPSGEYSFMKYDQRARISEERKFSWDQLRLEKKRCSSLNNNSTGSMKKDKVTSHRKMKRNLFDKILQGRIERNNEKYLNVNNITSSIYNIKNIRFDYNSFEKSRSHSKRSQKSNSSLMTLCLGDTPLSVSHSKQQPDLYSASRFPTMSSNHPKRSSSSTISGVSAEKTKIDDRKIRMIKLKKMGMVSLKYSSSKKRNLKVERKNRFRNPSQGKRDLSTYLDSRRLDYLMAKYMRQQQKGSIFSQNPPGLNIML